MRRRREYLWRDELEEVAYSSGAQRCGKQYKKKGFPGCVGAIHCTKLFWKNYPTHDNGKHLNIKDSKLASIQCEAWFDADLHCWDWHFGRPATNHDINVLMRSLLLQGVVSGRFSFRLLKSYCIIPDVVERTMQYFLGYGIYPDWPLFIKSVENATNVNGNRFRSNKEAARKDVERLFEVIKGILQILRREIQSWELDEVVLIANTCAVRHNLIVRMQQIGDFRDEADGVI